MKEARKKGVHTTMLFHLHEILEQVKLMGSDPKKKSGWLEPKVDWAGVTVDLLE